MTVVNPGEGKILMFQHDDEHKNISNALGIPERQRIQHGPACVLLMPMQGSETVQPDRSLTALKTKFTAVY